MNSRKCCATIPMGKIWMRPCWNLANGQHDEDLDIFITTLLIHLQVGGDLSEILDTISETIRERVKLKGDIRTMTAQSQMSAVVIGIIAGCDCSRDVCPQSELYRIALFGSARVDDGRGSGGDDAFRSFLTDPDRESENIGGNPNGNHSICFVVSDQFPRFLYSLRSGADAEAGSERTAGQCEGDGGHKGCI